MIRFLWWVDGLITLHRMDCKPHSPLCNSRPPPPWPPWTVSTSQNHWQKCRPQDASARTCTNIVFQVWEILSYLKMPRCLHCWKLTCRTLRSRWSHPHPRPGQLIDTGRVWHMKVCWTRRGTSCTSRPACQLWSWRRRSPRRHRPIFASGWLGFQRFSAFTITRGHHVTSWSIARWERDRAR